MRSGRIAVRILALLAPLAIACGRPPPAESQASAPPVASAAPATTQPPQPAAATVEQPKPVVPSEVTPPVASAQPPPPADEPLVDADGKPLPQTEDKPSTTDERFQRRVQLLARAIREDDPSVALPTFFPLVAYQQVKDVQKPERDYKLRLIAAFERNVHEYHRALGPDAKDAQLAGVDVPEDKARWMKPGSEGNRIGYFRVLRSQLRFTLPAGKTKTFELTSLISWRGQWYVVHLNGFK
jgi:hypothetical protein